MFVSVQPVSAYIFPLVPAVNALIMSVSTLLHLRPLGKLLRRWFCCWRCCWSCCGSTEERFGGDPLPLPQALAAESLVVVESAAAAAEALTIALASRVVEAAPVLCIHGGLRCGAEILSGEAGADPELERRRRICRFAGLRRRRDSPRGSAEIDFINAFFFFFDF